LIEGQSGLNFASRIPAGKESVTTVGVAVHMRDWDLFNAAEEVRQQDGGVAVIQQAIYSWAQRLLEWIGLLGSVSVTVSRAGPNDINHELGNG
jgi:hypothetical protein